MMSWEVTLLVDAPDHYDKAQITDEIENGLPDSTALERPAVATLTFLEESDSD